MQAKAIAQTEVITKFIRANCGDFHRSSGTRPRAYCSVKGLPIAMEMRIIRRSPASTRSLTLKTVSGVGNSFAQASRPANNAKVPSSKNLGLFLADNPKANKSGGSAGPPQQAHDR